MSLFLEQKELFDRILLLEEDEAQEPIGVFERFFSDYHLHECRCILWNMVVTCLTTDNTEFSEPAERASLMMNYKNLERLLEAGSLLLEQYHAAAKKGGVREESRKN
ncbi:MAG TPA: hypothetical protein VG605_01630 [Puia sp.]|nr:hypothetical protein [Puia sp.]